VSDESRLNRFVSGHGFSRAAKTHKGSAFRP
jgi:hypothetical protein